MTCLLWFINDYKATNITTGGHHLVGNESFEVTKKTAPSKLLNATTPEFDRYRSEQYGQLTGKSHWQNSLSRHLVCSGSLLIQPAHVQWTQGAPGSPREPGILDWNLHNSGIILAVSESGAHRIVVLVLGGKQKGTRLSFLRLCNSFFLRRQWTIHHLQTIILLDLNVLPCHVFRCLG